MSHASTTPRSASRRRGVRDGQERTVQSVLHFAIGRDSQFVAAGDGAVAAGLPRECERRRGALRVEVDREHPGAGRGERPRGGAADARGRAGHERGPAGEVVADRHRGRLLGGRASRGVVAVVVSRSGRPSARRLRTQAF